MFTLIATIFLVIIFIILAFKLYQTSRSLSRIKKLAAKIPGPKGLPIIGNALEPGGVFANPQDLFLKIWNDRNEYGDVVRIWIAQYLLILTYNPKLVELILSSTELIDKGFNYKFLHPWLGTGLLTSTGKKWQIHRKILTPSFHFSILEGFLDIFVTNGNILIEKLKKHVDGEEFDIYHYITLCTLDNICETAMGISVKAQLDESSEYVQAVRNISGALMKRTFQPWLHPDFLFNLTSTGKLQRKSLAILHGTTKKVINGRKTELLKNTLSRDDHVEINQCGMRRRKAFLDILLEATMNKNLMTDEELREEVDTFMFEGHDTTSSAISFALLSLALNQDIQHKVYEEQLLIFGDSDREATFNDIHYMKYLEMVIKETLRLYPSVPIYARELSADVHFDGFVIPKGANIVICAYVMHRDPALFPDPDKFDPERFTVEDSRARSPFTYVPFSAGSRNCIGQKFAMLELKATLSKIIRNYKLLPGSTTNNIEELTAELIIKNTNGIKIRLASRR